MYNNYKPNNKLINNASTHKKTYCKNPFNSTNPRLNLGLLNQFKKIKLPKVPKISWSLLKFIFILILITGSIFWCLFMSGWFEINRITINYQDLRYVNGDQVENLANQQLFKKKYQIPQKYFFTFSKTDLLNTLKKQWLIETIEINKNFLTNSLVINIIEKKLDLTWCELDECYYLDETGAIITTAPQAESAIHNLDLSQLIDNKIKIDQKFLDFAYKLLRVREFNGIKVKRYYVDNEPRSIKLNLTDGPEIYFNIDENFNTQVNSLNLLLKERAKSEDIKKISYIDLRYGDKIFYK